MKVEVKNPGGLPTIDYRTLVPFQGDLKDFHEREYAKLKKSVLELGWVFPFFVWFDGETPRILDGHGRHRLAVREKIKPYELPYVRIDAANEQEAKKLLLVATSQYQRITQEGFDAFTFDMDEAWIGETVNFDGVFSGLGEEDMPSADELIGEDRNKPATLKITFKNVKQLHQAENDIQELIDRKYPGAYFSVSAGEV